MIIAALNFPFKACKGVELLPGLCRNAEESVVRLRERISKDDVDIELPEIAIHEEDLLKCPWNQEADIAYCANVTFTTELMNSIAEMCRSMKPGSRFVSLKMLECDYSDYLEDIAQINLKNSWGPQIAHVYRRK